MGQRIVWTFVTLTLLAVLSVPIYSWVASGSFKPCAAADLLDRHAKTIVTLDGIIDLGLKLSTTLVGLGAAILIGLKQGLKLTLPIQLLIVIATILFVDSDLYAVWWRVGVAEIWLNECFDLVTEPRISRRFEAHFGFFILGLISLGALVIGALMAVPVERKEDFS